MSSAIVVGDGIVGLTTALALLERGVEVQIVGDPDGEAAASWGNAGHIAVEQVEPLASYANILAIPRRLFTFGGPAAFPMAGLGAWLPFGLRMLARSSGTQFAAGRTALAALAEGALPAWRRLAGRLESPGLLVERGHLVVWESRLKMARGLADWTARSTGAARFGELPPAELARIARLVRKPLAGGIRFDGTASIASHGALRNALRRAIERAGGRMIAERVSRLADLDADMIAVCAGFGSGELLRRHARCRVPIIAERGYHIEGTAPTWPRETPPVVFEERSIIATRFDERLRIAGFVEFSSARMPPDLRKFDTLERHCDDLGIDLVDRTRWMGARPTLPDYLPAIGRAQGDRRVFYAFGHQHLGLTLGPVTAELMADTMAGREPAIDLHPFDLTRFG